MSLIVRLQFTSLPSLAFQLILRQLACGVKRNFQNLRLCSHSWKEVCNDAAEAVSTDVNLLTVAMPFIKDVPKLLTLTIQGSGKVPSTISSGKLCALGARQLQVLKLLGAGLDGSYFAYGPHKMEIADCVKLLAPWSQSLRTLHLEHCHLLGAEDESSLGSAGFFCKFPHLTDVKLHRVKVTPALTALDLNQCINLRNFSCSDNTLTTLQLAGCKQLKALNCEFNAILALDLSDCTELNILECGCNRLTALELATCTKLERLSLMENDLVTLDLRSCPDLKQLQCTDNHRTPNQPKLQSVFFSAAARLDTVRIDIQHPGLATSGATSIRDLYCDASSLSSIPMQVCANLEHVDLTGSLHEALAGFHKLQFLNLECSIGPAGSLDLSGCTSCGFDSIRGNRSLACTGLQCSHFAELIRRGQHT